MTRHVTSDEFRNDPAKYMDQVGVEPLRVEHESGAVVMIGKQSTFSAALPMQLDCFRI
jgi:hypothetical protein